MARALRRHLNRALVAGNCFVYFRKGHFSNSIELPRRVQDFIMAFDASNIVTPIRFTINVPR